jgi:hypothetical protein
MQQYYRVELWKGLKCARIAIKALDDHDARERCIRLFGSHLSVIVGPVYDVPEILQLDPLSSVLCGDALMAVAQPNPTV